MSRTASAIARIDSLLDTLRALPAGSPRDQLLVETEALHRAVVAFHMEAIRFRMHAVDRLLKGGDQTDLQRLFGELRGELEAAGFHTRSHSAP